VMCGLYRLYLSDLDVNHIPRTCMAPRRRRRGDAAE
jgi:hypothetical protein